MNISELIIKRLIGKITPDEDASLQQWMSEDPVKRGGLIEELTDPSRLDELWRRRELVDSEAAYQRMDAMLSQQRNKEAKQRRTIAFRRIGIAVASAACVLGIILLFNQSKNRIVQSPNVARVETPLNIDDIEHGSMKAMLVTANGDSMELREGEALNLYKVSQSTAKREEAQSLSLSVPRGGEFKIVLEDSTEIWLNSDSRLIYPEHFSASNRRVTLEGEAYFKVHHQSNRPFYVVTGNQTVKVYGTEFNLRAYQEDEKIYTTLCNGKVSIMRTGHPGAEVFLSPGHQSAFDRESGLTTIARRDIDVVSGWRQGKFVFEEQTLYQIMQDLARWYDIEFEFADNESKNKIFMGSIPRYANFKTAIAILEKSGGLKFTTKENKVYIENSRH